MSYIGNEPIVSATRTVTETTALAGQTVFTANGGYTVGYIDVFVNGAQLQRADFTATNGSTVTLATPCALNDDVRLVAWGVFQTVNTFAQAQGDVFYENSQTVNASYTLTSGKNAMSAGPITINSGVTVTIPSGSSWVIV